MKLPDYIKLVKITNQQKLIGYIKYKLKNYPYIEFIIGEDKFEKILKFNIVFFRKVYKYGGSDDDFFRVFDLDQNEQQVCIDIINEIKKYNSFELTYSFTIDPTRLIN